MIEKKIVLAGIDAVDSVVGTHDRPRVAMLDRNLERQQIRFAQRRFADIGAQHAATCLLVVEGKMLHRRNHLLALYPANDLAGDRSSEERIFTRILEGTAAARLARQIERTI